MKFKRVDEQRYDEMLGILPPVAFTSSGFMVGEPWTHDEADRPMFAAFIRVDGCYYEATGPMTVAEFRSFDRRAAARDAEESK